MMERLKQVRKRWYIPGILILMGISLMIPLGVINFIEWFVQQPPLVSLAILGLIPFSIGMFILFGIWMFTEI